MLVVPRATAIDLKNVNKGIAALEFFFFANVKLVMGGFEAGRRKKKIGCAREKKFKVLVSKALE